MPAPHHSLFTGRVPFLPPNQQRHSTDGKGFYKALTGTLILDVEPVSVATQPPEVVETGEDISFRRHRRDTLLLFCYSVVND